MTSRTKEKKKDFFIKKIIIIKKKKRKQNKIVGKSEIAKSELKSMEIVLALSERVKLKSNR